MRIVDTGNCFNYATYYVRIIPSLTCVLFMAYIGTLPYMELILTNIIIYQLKCKIMLAFLKNVSSCKFEQISMPFIK